MEKKFDVIGFGDPFQDLDIQLSKLPETNVNMRMNDYCFMGGGNVPTAMVAPFSVSSVTTCLGGLPQRISPTTMLIRHT